MTTLYDLAGGHERLLAMTRAFYGKAVGDGVLGDMFGKAAGRHAEHLAGWLAASFGGPPDYLATRGNLAFVIWKHAGLKVTEPQRARWEALMMQSAREVGMPEVFLRPFGQYVNAITHNVVAHSNHDLDVLRGQLGMPAGTILEPLVPDADDRDRSGA